MTSFQLQLSTDYQIFSVYGISTFLKIPTLAWKMNCKLELHLKFSEHFFDEKKDCIYEHLADHQTIHLLTNTTEHPWYKTLKTLDYFCIFQNFSETQILEYKQSLLEISELSFVVNLPITTLKNKKYLDLFVL